MYRATLTENTLEGKRRRRRRRRGMGRGEKAGWDSQGSVIILRYTKREMKGMGKKNI